MSTTTAPASVRRWWRTLIAHRPIEVEQAKPPECPICERRKCQPWADAFADLLAADEWHKGPPPDIDRPHQAAGADQMETPA